MKTDRRLLFLAVTLFCAAGLVAVQAQTFQSFHSFNGTDGANPYTTLVQGVDGALYGTTIDGGANASGNIITVSPGGSVTSIYSFCSQQNCLDGEDPTGGLAVGPDGALYGTASEGGSPNGYGTIFKITRQGELTTLHTFLGSDGAAPYGTMALGRDGNFYGTANVGGRSGGGVFFRITPDGTYTPLYTFCMQSGCPDGQNPVGPIILGSDGSFYGTAHSGSNSACNSGCGTVFKITPNGTLTTLHAFNGTDGSYPYGGVVEGLDGNFYGTSGAGGTDNQGTVFTVTPGGQLTTLHSFDNVDGGGPYAMMLGSDGNFYGTTSAGGGGFHQFGTLFEITPDGSFTSLHIFNGKAGAALYSGMMQATNGTFVGGTYFGGAFQNGTLYSLRTGLDPFVEFVRASGKVGESGGILGKGLKEATEVAINGTPASFRVISDTLIRATIPAGATSGFVSVTTPGGVLTSNVPFVVVK